MLNTSRVSISQSTRARLLVFLTVLGLLVLSACQVRIDTTLVFETPEKGSRVMVATYDPPGSTPEEIATHGAKVDASIKLHKPVEISYLGYKIVEKSIVLTFKLEFANLAEYRTKVAALLKASGKDIVPEINAVSSNKGLVSGVTVAENFKSEDLLAWIPPSLAADAVVPKSDADGVYASGGDNIVKIDGKVFKPSYMPIKVNEVDDIGFSNVRLDLKAHADNSFEATVLLQRREVANAIDQKKIDEYLKLISPTDAVIGALTAEIKQTYDKSGTGSQVGFSAKNLDDLNAKLAKLLGTPTSKVVISREISLDNPTMFEVNVDASLACVDICSPDADKPAMRVEVPDDWYPSGGAVPSDTTTIDEAGVITQSGGSMEFSYVIPFPLNDVSAVTTVAADRSLAQKITYTLDSNTEAEVVASYRTLLRPASDIGAFKETKGDKVYSFEATFVGANAKELESKLQKYAPDSKVRLTETGGNALWPKYDVQVDLAVFKQLPSGFSGKFMMSVEVPKFNSIDDGQTKVVRAAGGASASTDVSIYFNSDAPGVPSLKVAATGPSESNVIAIAVIGLCILLVVLAALIFRKKIARTATALWSRRDVVQAGAVTAITGAGAVASAAGVAAAQAASTAASTANAAAVAGLAAVDTGADLAGQSQPYFVAPTVATHGQSSGEDAQWSTNFTEHQLQ